MAPKELKMGDKRTSLKDVLAAIEQQGQSIDALVTALTKDAIAPAAAIAAPVIGETPKVEVAEGYMAKMTEKAANHATTKGSEVVLYARKNQRGETKLAYALRDRFDSLNDKGMIGPVGTFQP
jgi:hypothetical protein